VSTTPGPTGPTGANGGTLAFASPQAAQAFNFSSQADFTVASVGVVNDLYLLQKSPPVAPTSDGLNVITPAGPPGARLFRIYVPNTPASYQASWAVNSASGDDRNDGTPAHPLQTGTELARRFNSANFQITDVDVAITGTISGVPLNRISCAGGTLVKIHGNVTSSAPRAIATVTPESPSTNVRGHITDAGGAFAQGQRLRLVTGTHTGYVAYCLAGTTATDAVVSQWSLLGDLHGLLNTIPSQANPTAGDQYVTDTLTSTLLLGPLSAEVTNSGRLVFQDLVMSQNIAGPGFPNYQYGSTKQNQSQPGGGTVFAACKWDNSAGAGMATSSGMFLQCLFQQQFGIYFNSSGLARNCVWNGGISGGFAGLNVFGNSFLQLSNANYLDQSGIVQTSGGVIEANGATITGNQGPGGTTCWEVDPGCFVYSHNNARFWGPAGATNYGLAIRVFTNGAYSYVNVPTLAGSTVADTEVSGTTKAYAALPFFNTTTPGNISNLT
jgi:hypothetical protein